MSITSEDAKRIFSDVDTKHQFWLKDMGAVKNLKELVEALKTMSDDVFKHHVTNERNDFSNWIRDIIEDKGLADSISKVKNQKKIGKIIEKKLKKIEKTETEAKKPKKILKKKSEEPPDELPSVDIRSKIDEILQKEREIVKREEVIQNAEERIEKKMSHQPTEKKFFSKEFTQGIIIGILLATICFLIYSASLKGQL